jgi:hypothetical protein
VFVKGKFLEVVPQQLSVLCHERLNLLELLFTTMIHGVAFQDAKSLIEQFNVESIQPVYAINETM